MILAKALLGLLAQGEQHGYGMKRLIQAEFAPYWRVDTPPLYRALARMTRDGWVKSHTEMATGPGRRVYQITGSGRRVLEEWLSEPAQDHDEFFVKWHMGRDLDKPVGQLVSRERTRIEEELGRRMGTLRDARAAKDIDRVTIAEAALCQTEAELASLELVEGLSAGQPSAALAFPLSTLSLSTTGLVHYA